MTFLNSNTPNYQIFFEMVNFEFALVWPPFGEFWYRHKKLLISLKISNEFEKFKLEKFEPQHTHGSADNFLTASCDIFTSCSC